MHKNKYNSSTSLKNKQTSLLNTEHSHIKAYEVYFLHRNV